MAIGLTNRTPTQKKGAIKAPFFIHTTGAYFANPSTTALNVALGRIALPSSAMSGW